MSLSYIPLSILSLHTYVHASAFLFEKFRLVFSNTNKLFDYVFDPKIHSHTKEEKKEYVVSTATISAPVFM